jgi:hypothetical protein
MWEPPKTEVNKELEGNTQQQKNEPADYVKLSGKLILVVEFPQN